MCVLCSPLTEQLLLKNQREQLSFLTRTDPLVAEKAVLAKLGENVSFIPWSLFVCLPFFIQPECPFFLIYLCFFNLIQRNICIEKALNAPGITTKDPKVAVTDNFLCTGGRIDQREHIACTGLSHFTFDTLQ